jgi:hypothetical protein
VQEAIAHGAVKRGNLCVNGWDGCDGVVHCLSSLAADNVLLSEVRKCVNIVIQSWAILRLLWQAVVLRDAECAGRGLHGASTAGGRMAERSKGVRLEVRLSGRLAGWVAARAAERGESQAALVRRLLADRQEAEAGRGGL